MTTRKAPWARVFFDERGQAEFALVSSAPSKFAWPVYLTLKSFADHKTGIAWPDRDTLVERSGLQWSSRIDRALEALAKVGAIEVVEKGRPGRSSRYRLTKMSAPRAAAEDVRPARCGGESPPRTREYSAPRAAADSAPRAAAGTTPSPTPANLHQNTTSKKDPVTVISAREPRADGTGTGPGLLSVEEETKRSLLRRLGDLTRTAQQTLLTLDVYRLRRCVEQVEWWARNPILAPRKPVGALVYRVRSGKELFDSGFMEHVEAELRAEYAEPRPDREPRKEATELGDIYADIFDLDDDGDAPF